MARWVGNVRRRRLCPRRPGTAPPATSRCCPPATADPRAGRRATWAASTTDVRALQAPTRIGAPGDRAGTDASQVRVRLNVHQRLHGHPPPLRASTGSTTARRENVTVNDGTTTQDDRDHEPLQRRRLDALPGQRAAPGARSWSPPTRRRRQRRAQRPVPGRGRDAAPAAAAPAAAVRDRRPRATGSARTASTATPSAAWNGTAGDLAVLPAATADPRAGRPRRRWAASTTDVRALQSADRHRAPGDRPGTTRPSPGAAHVHRRLHRARSTSTPSTGSTTARRENVTVNDGTTTKTVARSRAASTPAPGCTSRSASRPGARSVVTVNKVGRRQRRAQRPVPGRAGTPPTSATTAAARTRPGAPGHLGRHVRRRRL